MALPNGAFLASFRPLNVASLRHQTSSPMARPQRPGPPSLLQWLLQSCKPVPPPVFPYLYSPVSHLTPLQPFPVSQGTYGASILSFDALFLAPSCGFQQGLVFAHYQPLLSDPVESVPVIATSSDNPALLFTEDWASSNLSIT